MPVAAELSLQLWRRPFLFTSDGRDRQTKEEVLSKSSLQTKASMGSLMGAQVTQATASLRSPTAIMGDVPGQIPGAPVGSVEISKSVPFPAVFTVYITLYKPQKLVSFW